MDLNALALALALTATPHYSDSTIPVDQPQPTTRTVINLSPPTAPNCEQIRVVQWKHKEVHRIINDCTGEILDEIWIRY